MLSGVVQSHTYPYQMATLPKECWPKRRLIFGGWMHHTAARVDILAPCALGGILNPHSLPRIAAPIIAGSANNQLSDDEVGDMLWRADILYAPDYVINAGGVINVAAESSGHYDKRQVMRQVCRIGGTLQGIFARAKCEDRSPHRIADEIALERLRAARTLQTAA